MDIVTQRAFTYEHGFADFLTVRDLGEAAEIDEKMFYYWLEVLPPVGFTGACNGEVMRMDGKGYGGAWIKHDGSVMRFAFAFAEGQEPITVFWSTKGEPKRHFAQRTAIINRS